MNGLKKRLSSVAFARRAGVGRIGRTDRAASLEPEGHFSRNTPSNHSYS